MLVGLWFVPGWCDECRHSTEQGAGRGTFCLTEKNGGGKREKECGPKKRKKKGTYNIKSIQFSFNVITVGRRHWRICIINNNWEMEVGLGFVLCCDHSNCIKIIKLYLLAGGLWALHTPQALCMFEGILSNFFFFRQFTRTWASTHVLVKCLKKKKIKKKKNSPRLTLQRELGRKYIFYYCERVYVGITGKESKKWKTQKWQGNISKTSCFFHRLKRALPHANLPRWLSFSLFLFFRKTSSSPWLRPKTMSLSASSVHHITLLNTIFDQCLHRRLFRPLPQLHLWPPLAQQRAHIKKTSS